MAREVIKVLRRETGKHTITHVQLDDGTTASVYGEAKVGDKMMVYYRPEWDRINARHLNEGKGDGSKGLKKES